MLIRKPPASTNFIYTTIWCGLPISSRKEIIFSMWQRNRIILLEINFNFRLRKTNFYAPRFLCRPGTVCGYLWKCTGVRFKYLNPFERECPRTGESIMYLPVSGPMEMSSFVLIEFPGGMRRQKLKAYICILPFVCIFYNMNSKHIFAEIIFSQVDLIHIE